MTTIDSLPLLLAKLNSGDEAAAEEAFRAFEPYLRTVVRRMLPARLRAKFDSVDVVQSTYVDVLVAFRAQGMRFGSVAQLRAFLIRATRNRFIDRLRQHDTATRREEPLDLMVGVDGGPPSAGPRPSESARADELWQRLLALCPAEHRELLRLRRAGWSIADIGARVTMHQGSVRRVLRELSIRLACDGVASRGPAGSAT